MSTFHIHIAGRVQGVGFRPFVYRLAGKHGLSGTVCNAVDGVHVQFNASVDAMEAFRHDLQTRAPRNAIIEHLDTDTVAPQDYRGFKIVSSDASGRPDLLITPDFALCPDCLHDMQNPADRRHGYAFITCTHCGPRYSILTGLPYDRPRTTMAPFRMCDECAAEYENVADRRFYSQTNSCPRCAVQLQLTNLENGDVETNQGRCIDHAVTALKEGEILAVKGIGGYLLMVDAANAGAVRRLRRRKHRPRKPLALMYPSMEVLEQDVFVSDRERAEWHDPSAPIVLYRFRPGLRDRLPLEDLAPGLGRIGVMPPYAPLLALIMKRTARPLVATSGNISGSPIVYRDSEAREALGDIADHILTNNRDIAMPQDDSVVVHASSAARVVIRRSRGMAPAAPPGAAPRGYDRQVLAMGAEIKSAFGIWDGRRTYVSQFLGDTGQLPSQNSYEHALRHMMGVLDLTPSTVLVDAHPDYYTAHYGRSVAAQLGVPVRPVQHHEAHFASVMAEHGLLGAGRPVLGIIFDGTGYGRDGAIWGGEVFAYRQHAIKRVWHVPYYPHIGGDRMALDPRVSALAVFDALDKGQRLSGLFDDKTYALYKRLLEVSTTKTSSVGRLFDAVAGLAQVSRCNTYEGEAAMWLESMAEGRLQGHEAPQDDDEPDRYYRQMIEMLWRSVVDGDSPAQTATLLHRLLAGLVECIVQREDVEEVCFSGGVFQNTIMADLIVQRLARNRTLYFHKHLSPNDEGIAFGQLAFHCWGL